MLKIYKYTTPNINNGLHFYFTDFQSYLNHLAEPYMEIEQNSYQINNDVILINTNNQNLDVNDITYVIDYNEEYYRCFHVTSANLQSGYILLNISIDYWGTYIAKCSIDDIVVNRCNRNIGVGVYDDILQTEEKTIQNYYKLYSRYDLAIVFFVVYKTSTSSIFQNNSSTTIKPFYVNLFNFTRRGMIGNYWYISIDKALQKISNINKITFGDETYDANVVKTFILPNEFLTLNNNNNTFTFSTIPSENFNADGEIFSSFITINIDDNYKINPLINYKQYFGTFNDMVAIPRLTQPIKPNITCVTSQDDIRVSIGIGDLNEDITNNFSVTITTNDGNLTTQEKISKSLNALTGVIGGISQMSYGGLGAISGGLTIANSFSEILGGKRSNGGYTNGGDGVTTFFKHLGDNDEEIIHPFKLIKFESIKFEDDLIRLRGANFNKRINNIENIFAYDLLVSGTTKTFVAMECNIHGVCLNAINEIKNKFSGGVLIEKL